MRDGRTQTTIYWEDSFQIEDGDLEHLYNLLIEDETPLTPDEMARALVERRFRQNAERRQRERAGGARTYLPKETYQIGDTLIFPALHYDTGTVQSIRSGGNPEHPAFDVLAVDFSGERVRHFAARLADHPLNLAPEPGANGLEGEASADEVLAQFGASIAERLTARLQAASDLVRIAGRWFPRALLVSINAGHLNLAEAVLDVNGGGPLPTGELQPHLELPRNVNPKLAAFSLDYALQEDERFDEVGPSGQVLWHLRRLEPPEVLYPPRRLAYLPVAQDRSRLTPELVKLESDLDDEFSDPPAEANGGNAGGDELVFPLIFPHRRVGTLPLSSRLLRFFPTAYESPRIRFMLVDGDTGEKFPGWVVREHRFVFGLDEWYRKNGVVAGAYIGVQSGQQSGEVRVRARKRRPVSEWVRTGTANDPRGITYSMKRQPIGVEYDEHMVVIIDGDAAVDEAWLKFQERHVPFPNVVANVFRDLAKLNPQSAVHARSLYSGVNVVRRVPPGPIFAELAQRPYFVHVGDLYWRFDESHWSAPTA